MDHPKLSRNWCLGAWRAESGFDGLFSTPKLRPFSCSVEKLIDFGSKRKNMKTFKICLSVLALVVVGTLVGCSTTSTKAASVSDSIRTPLDQAGFKDVSVTQDRDKGIVTLGGHVSKDADKAQAESIARSMAGTQVVANQIAVIPPGVESLAKTVNSDLDKGIESNLDAALIVDNLHETVKYL